MESHVRMDLEKVLDLAVLCAERLSGITWISWSGRQLATT